MYKGLPVFDCFALTDDPNLLELQIMQQQTESCSCMKSMTLTNFWFLHGRNQFQGCPASLAWRDTSFALCKKHPQSAKPKSILPLPVSNSLSRRHQRNVTFRQMAGMHGVWMPFTRSCVWTKRTAKRSDAPGVRTLQSPYGSTWVIMSLEVKFPTILSIPASLTHSVSSALRAALSTFLDVALPVGRTPLQRLCVLPRIYFRPHHDAASAQLAAGCGSGCFNLALEPSHLRHSARVLTTSHVPTHNACATRQLKKQRWEESEKRKEEERRSERRKAEERRSRWSKRYSMV